MSQEANNNNGNQNAAAAAQNAGAAGGITPPAGERTFTQAQLDAIVADRLNREKAKFADYETLKDKAAKFDAAEEAGKTEIQKATDKAAALEKELNDLKQKNATNAMRAKVAAEMKLPAELAEFLTAGDEEGCKAQAKKLLDTLKPNGYPNVRDGGGTNPNGSGSGGGSTRDQFAAVFESL